MKGSCSGGFFAFSYLYFSTPPFMATVSVTTYLEWDGNTLIHFGKKESGLHRHNTEMQGRREQLVVLNLCIRSCRRRNESAR